MIEFLTKVHPGILIILCLTIASLVSTAAHYWHKSRKIELEASLKLEMIQRGMSAEEIERVMRASVGSGRTGENASGRLKETMPEQV